MQSAWGRSRAIYFLLQRIFAADVHIQWYYQFWEGNGWCLDRVSSPLAGLHLSMKFTVRLIISNVESQSGNRNSVNDWNDVYEVLILLF